ncbi:N-acetylglucosamine-6-phosphate deacetylase [Haloactinopolyspora alba]|uniref:N-acetylglucosamine-6-phosphate deacetylase n=1 Tax=Haloactinopolyspora alba TaxID=648780 RepID=A0A2P8DT91_9ACTN|nr:amidohydrolase family protein [Haloactinopolyspora alba]PSL00432.1 N-acetylglucosamine-6-phosphate deacetylase [Haloactinopolyspora alba]
MRTSGTVTIPGLVDLQVNGYGGLDVNATDVDAETIIELTRAMWRQGVTTFLPTVITAAEPAVTRALRAVREARSGDPLVAHTIAGVHVEGPAVNTDDGPRGAHDARFVRPPSLAELDRWQDAADGLVRVVTLAPETDGALEYVAGAAERGVLISLGHCAPEPDQVRAAARVGATLSTHLGNGTHGMLPRHPNHVWAQLAEDALTAMFIADGHHLPADTLTAMVRAKSPERSVLTSDAAALAGCPPGEYRTPVGGSVTVRADGRLGLTGTDLLAGAGASLLACLDWAWERLPFDPATTLAMATVNPARVLGVGERARAAADGGDVTVLDRADGVSRVVATRLGDTEVYVA